ncbi:deoxyribose-phosphate aldolase [Pseudomonas sp. 21LCFQ02]|uniref:deoxyribose-phosphate aldolase n=1 Tax=Pseudomonas sp. 21LCFQ02 TaxID=2957505 RepID=UPI00209BB5A4|nr:deoxyribose-phosphate aldolase [Pseudomonas sp. 21LCFQ02]MCO8170477.1 deoxyribose-phosphate aldolase [Pseudomonas sp. 21LCFQ02]
MHAMSDDAEQLALRALEMLELLALNHDDSEERIINLCKRALTPVGAVAAVCVAPRFVCLARTALDRLRARQVRVVAQVNFPWANDSVDMVVREARAALVSGADEIDVVYPFRTLLAGNAPLVTELLAACKAECGSRASFTVTLEAGELRDPQLIRSACRDAIAAGADFIKSCTDRLVAPVSPQIVRIMLESIAETGGLVGCKIVGGVRTLNDARPLMSLASSRFSSAWCSPQRVRIGGSVLLDDLLVSLGVLEAGRY